MKKKLRLKFSEVIAILVMTGGVILGVSVLILHFQSEGKLNKLLSDRAIVRSEEQGTTTESAEIGNQKTLSELSDGSITEDQVVTIKDGTPVIEVPSLNITIPIVEGTDKESLKYGAGHFIGTASYGEIGNCALAGHSSTIYNCVFNGLEDIKVLDKINIYNSSGTKFAYTVTSTSVISPEAVTVLGDFGDTRLTVVTCTDGGKKRFCVVAKLLSDSDVESLSKTLNANKIATMKSLSSRFEKIGVSNFLSSRSKALEKVYHSFPRNTFKEHMCEFSDLFSSKKLFSNE